MRGAWGDKLIIKRNIEESKDLFSPFGKLVWKSLTQFEKKMNQFKIFCTGSETNCTKGKIELQHIHTTNT